MRDQLQAVAHVGLLIQSNAMRVHGVLRDPQLLRNRSLGPVIE